MVTPPRVIDFDRLLELIDERVEHYRLTLDDPAVRESTVQTAANAAVALALGELGLQIRKASA